MNRTSTPSMPSASSPAPTVTHGSPGSPKMHSLSSPLPTVRPEQPSQDEPPPAQQPATDTQESRSLSEIIEEAFEPFDCQSEIVGPFEEEQEKDREFQREISAMLLDATIEFHAWASARPKYENALAMSKLEDKMAGIQATEKQQGTSSLDMPSHPSKGFIEMTREKLRDFVNKMRTAIAALTGPML